ncbi:hypothetical protein Btru_048923 [Bulinus truncatus]|nr:hypothetical protein Btru_048923 [Bulinus truncatus]
MDKGETLEDDFFNIVCGDLGLGETSSNSPCILSNRLCHSDLNISVQNSGHVCKTHSHCILSENKSIPEPRTVCTYKRLAPHPVKINEGGTDLEHFPVYADVPYGTSIKQQKELFEKQIDNLQKQFSTNQVHKAHGTAENITDFPKNCGFKASKKNIEHKLLIALQEMDELKIELDACRRRLEAKYKAVAILKEQAEHADTELKNTEKKACETSRKLEQEVSKLQFELEWRESSFLDSQQTWAERFDRACQENGILMSKLEARNEELRRANAHKSALARERDELLALLDVTERQKYEHGKSGVAQEEYETFSSTELAVLGACRCRVTNPDPCGCAHAAANLRKEVSKLKDELMCSLQRREEANLTVEAYRTAFEEQLARIRSMSLKLSHLATISSRSAKAKAAIKWLVQVLNDDEYSPPQPIETAVEADKGQTLTTMSLQELVTLLTEMVIEKNEVLAHNKLASQILSNKLSKYEKEETANSVNTSIKNKEEQASFFKTGANNNSHSHLHQSNDAADFSDDETETTYQKNLPVVNQTKSIYLNDTGISDAEDDFIKTCIETKSDQVIVVACQSKDDNESKEQDLNDDFNNNGAKEKIDERHNPFNCTEVENNECETVNQNDFISEPILAKGCTEVTDVITYREEIPDLFEKVKNELSD